MHYIFFVCFSMTVFYKKEHRSIKQHTSKEGRPFSGPTLMPFLSHKV